MPTSNLCLRWDPSRSVIICIPRVIASYQIDGGTTVRVHKSVEFESLSVCVMLRTRSVVPIQPRRHKVGLGFGGVRRGEELSVESVHAVRSVVGEVAVV